MDSLPLELQREIVLLLEPRDITTLSLLSRHWCVLVNDPSIWKPLYERDKNKWKVAVNGTTNSKTIDTPSQSSIWSKLLSSSQNAVKDFLQSYGLRSNTQPSSVEQPQQSNKDWKRMYLDQYIANYRISKGIYTSPGIQRSTSQVHRIPVFGDGLDTSAKKLLYNMMWGSDSPFPMTQLYAGVEGIGSGVGFNVNGAELNLAALYKCEDRGVFDKIRPQWREFFKGASGFVFVVDWSDLEQAKHDFEVFLGDVHAISSRGALVVLSCADPAHSRSAMPPIDLAHQLGLLNPSSLDTWAVFQIDYPAASTGLKEALLWLSSKLP